MLMNEVNLRIAWLISRACAPMVTSPIWPSNSAFVISAATESSTTTSTAFDLISVSAMVNASSPESGWETSSSFMLTPSLRA